MSETLRIVAAFTETLWRTRPGLSRADFERWQARKLDHWLRHDLPSVAFYRDARPKLESLPVIDKAVLMDHFAAFNRAGLTAEQGWQAFDAGGAWRDIHIGSSTGTSGNRALYAITGQERCRWLGTILAKAIPRFLIEPERVAIILPQNSALYDNPSRSQRLQLKFFDLREGAERWLAALEAFAPTTIVAPPRLLRHLGEISRVLAPRRLFAGAETLDPNDRAIIEARFGVALGQIYMATEGLLAVTCAKGHLHLAEDANHFEFEPVADGLVTPVISSFRRRFQIMARYRMNDVLRLGGCDCPCGSPLRRVEEVIGRMDDVFACTRTDGVEVLVTPDTMRNAVLDADRTILDFRVRRVGRDVTELVLDPSLSPLAVERAEAALNALFAGRGVAMRIVLRLEPMPLDVSRKLRRVENRFRPEGGA